MIRILVAVDDSRPALAAAALAIDYARSHPTHLRFVAVTESGTDTTSILGHVGGLASNAGVEATVAATDGGQPYEAILAEAHRCAAHVIVMGRSDIRRPGQPYVGSQTEHLLEFTHIPVLVVPEPGPVSDDVD